uniref:RNase H type-1 domain-containing protein n=1 Tax=Cannabis sativa TaxID=3483 RepID=A0A803P3E2_CANSA
MRDLIDCIISETQSTFIPGRLISDNVMVVFKVMHYLKRIRRGKKGFMALKLDMSKAYDWVEWSFLRAVMNRMGFASKSIDLIMGCVSTVRYKVVHNGHVLDSISPSRGIRQRQKVNYSKSSIFFSPNTDATTRVQICSTLHMSEALEGSLYLGLLNIIGRNKNVVLGFLKNKVIARINSWDGKFLSRAGKEILLKTTNSNKGRGIIWMSWDRLATPEEEGGMGFRHLHDFNLAMLSKQGWRLLCKPDSLAGRVYKAKYFPNSDFISSDLGNNPSFVWRSIWGAKELIRLGAARVIGDGRNTRILGSPWLPSTDNKYVSSTHLGLRTHTVSSLFQPNMICWDADVVCDLFSPQEADLILGIPLSNTARPDCWSWTADHKGNFTVQSAYHLLQSQKPVGLRPNNSNFLRSLPTCVNLVTKYVPISSQCLVFHITAETTTHALLTCDFARACWAVFGWPVTVDPSSTFGYWFELLQNTSDIDFICRATTLCWTLWKARNKVVWNKCNSTVKEVLATSSITLEHWRKAQDKSALLSLSFNNSDEGGELWTPPATNNLKINVDAALFQQDNSYDYGLVARDHFGKFLEGKTCQCNGNYPAEVVEALGIKEALSWIKNKTWNNVELESDSLLSVQAIRSNQNVSSTFGIIIEDCRLLLSL